MEPSKKFTILPKQTIDTWVEAIGVSKIPEDVSEILSEDVTYHIRELVHKSIQIMKHSRRSYLTVDDVNSALQESDNSPIFGHNGIENLSYKAVPYREGVKTTYLDEKDINLRETAFETTYPSEAGETIVKSNWVVLEGHNCISRSQLRRDMETPLNEVMSTYLQNLTSALISNGDELRKIAIDDLTVNKKLQIIVPHIVSFFSAEIKRHTEKPTFPCIASHITAAISALVKNKSIILTPYLIQLAKILLFVLMEAKLNVNHWDLHQGAANVLALLARRHPHSSPDIREQLLKSYLDIFTEPSTKQPTQLHGALCGIKRLGVKAIVSGLFPKVLEKLDSLRKHLTPESEESITPEILHVCKELAETFSIFYQPRFQPVVKPLLRKGSTSKLNRFYNELYAILGDSFTVHLNLNLAARNNNTDTSLTVVSNGNSNHGTNSTSNNNSNNNVLQLKLPLNKTRQNDKYQDGSISNELKFKEPATIYDGKEKRVKEIPNEKQQKHSTESSLGKITLTSKWSKKSFVEPSNVLSDDWTVRVGTKPLIRQLDKKSRNIHKSLTVSCKKKRYSVNRKVFLTLPL